MKNKILYSLFILFFLTASCFGKEIKPREIVLWHAFDGYLEKIFSEIIEDFNHHSGNYKINAIRFGNYKEVFEKGLQNYEQHTPPHILHIYEVATLTAMLSKGVFYPLNQLMSSFHKKFDPDVYIDAVRSFYCNPNGQMMSLPWNASTGILFYNKQAFEKAGLDPNSPPATWEEFEKYAELLKQKGYVGFTTAWPAAYHLEHFCHWHNIPFATEENGFKGLSARLVFNANPQIFHISKVSEWRKQGYFQYTGPFNEDPERFFVEEKCAILLQGANRLPLLNPRANFPIGVGFLPYWKKLTSKPYNLNIGGGSFWVFNGFSQDEYRGIAQFFEYLSLPEIQAFWHQKTGYLPITDAAYYLTKKKGFYKDHPAAEIAVLEVMANPPTPFTRGIRLGNYIQIREKIVHSLEKAFSGELTPKEALDKAALEGNTILIDFEKRNST